MDFKKLDWLEYLMWDFMEVWFGLKFGKYGVYDELWIVVMYFWILLVIIFCIKVISLVLIVVFRLWFKVGGCGGF